MDGTARQYQGAGDLQLLRSFLASMRAATGHTCWHSGDLAWRFFLHSLSHNLEDTVRLWLAECGQVEAFAIVTPRSRAGNLLFDMQVHPQARRQGLPELILGWIESQAVAALPAPRLICTDTGVYDVDREQVAALRAHGFGPHGDGGVLLARSLKGPIPRPALPAGFRLRPLTGPGEAGPRANAHRDAFGSPRVSDEAYRHLIRTTGYACDWDLVAEAPDGSLAAFCLVWPDPASGTGEFEPVGTRPAFRRQGLARALLCEGLRRLAASGAQSAIVGPIADDDEAALALYHSAGFKVAHRLTTYALEWDTATAASPAPLPLGPGIIPPDVVPSPTQLPPC